MGGPKRRDLAPEEDEDYDHCERDGREQQQPAPVGGADRWQVHAAPFWDSARGHSSRGADVDQWARHAHPLGDGHVRRPTNLSLNRAVQTGG